ncbi:MAG: SusD/RagB family nutrient-binding outer membrane lipoprotein [Bacteroidota bacterium]
MRNKFWLYGLLIFMMLPSACTDDFEEINTPPTNPASVPADFVLTQVQYRSVREKGNSWTNQILQWGSWVQHYGNGNTGFTTPHYQDILNYNDDFWNNMYQNMNNARQGKILAEERDAPNIAAQKIAIFEIMEILNWLTLTDMVGDVPYFGALQGADNLTPSYDSQQDIYNDLDARLAAAASALNPNDGAFFGAADVFFNGDPQKWIKYANGLRMRIGLRIADADPAKAQSIVTSVMGGMLPSSNDDDAILPVENSGTVFSDMHRAAELLIRAPNDAPYISEALVTTMQATNDPRLPIIASPTPASVAAGGALEYRGVGPNLTDAQYADLNANIANFSRPNGELFFGPTTDRGQTSMSYAEMSFAKAEAALRGWGGSASDAQTFFEEGIRAALTRGDFPEFGISTQDVDDYVTANGTLSSNFDEALAQIMTEKWIALAFDQEDEAFSEWRRSGLPALDAGDRTANDTNGAIPRRMTYNNQEELLNPANWAAAVGRLSNGDTYLSRVWWDQ